MQTPQHLSAFVKIDLQENFPAIIFLPELIVLVDFVFPWGIEYPVVFLPQGLFTPGSFYLGVFANFLVLKDLAKRRDFQ
jgi:hypothetical protein